MADQRDGPNPSRPAAASPPVLPVRAVADQRDGPNPSRPAATPSPPVLPVRVVADQRYGPDAYQTIDLYVPESAAGPVPVIAFVHGGEFLAGDKRFDARKGRLFAEAGYLFAAINYRLCPGTHPTQSQDVAVALRWLRDRALSHGGDPDLLFLTGHSSGAHLAGLVGTDAAHLRLQGMEPTDLAGVILLDGAGYDVAARLKRANAHTRQVYTRVFGTDPEGWRRGSPTMHVEPGERLPPFLIFYAGKQPSPRTQALRLGALLRVSGARVDVVHIRERNHVTIEQRLGGRADSTTRRMVQFIEQQRAARLAAALTGGTPAAIPGGASALDYTRLH